MNFFLKKCFSLVALTCATFVLSGCPLMTRDDIQKEDEERQLKEQVTSIQKSKADSEVRYNDLQSDIRVVAGRIDTVDHNQQVAAQNNQKELETLRKLIDAQNEKIKMIEQHIDATETRLTAAIQAASERAPAPAPAPAASSGASKGDGKKDSGGYAEAESLFAAKDFKHAIVKYQAYRDKNPKGNKIADATYKIGLCFAELGSKKDAKEFYQETVDSYPGTTAAKKAKAKLDKIK